MDPLAGAALRANQGGHTLAKKILYAKLTYFDYLNKNFEHLNFRITKFEFNKNKSIATDHNKFNVVSSYSF